MATNTGPRPANTGLAQRAREIQASAQAAAIGAEAERSASTVSEDQKRPRAVGTTTQQLLSNTRRRGLEAVVVRLHVGRQEDVGMLGK